MFVTCANNATLNPIFFAILPLDEGPSNRALVSQGQTAMHDTVHGRDAATQKEEPDPPAATQATSLEQKG